MLRVMRFVDVTLASPTDLRDFYNDELELPLEGDEIVIGETRLRFRIEDGGAFYHFALLVPGDRFDAALAWAGGRVEILGDVFDFEFWNARAFYFHDPAGNIVELIAHHDLEENGRGGALAAEELVGFSELGVVGDPPGLVRDLEQLGIELWDGTADESGSLAFVGERGRTLIVAPLGRGWLPTGRPAEAHPVEMTISYSSAKSQTRMTPGSRRIRVSSGAVSA
jgi:catechol 2,3-dioxygenase-like lactoylglutathione lyase family enzyme